jgi:hypothetical protein
VRQSRPALAFWGRAGLGEDYTLGCDTVVAGCDLSSWTVSQCGWEGGGCFEAPSLPRPRGPTRRGKTRRAEHCLHMDGHGTEYGDGSHVHPIERSTLKLRSIENRNDSRCGGPSRGSRIWSILPRKSACRVRCGAGNSLLDILSVGSPGSHVMTLGPPRQAREFYYRGRGFGRVFYSPNHVPAFRSRPHSSRAKPSQINQSISKCIRACRVQLQKGNALANFDPLPPSTTTLPQTTQRTSREPHPRFLPAFTSHPKQLPKPRQNASQVRRQEARLQGSRRIQGPREEGCRWQEDRRDW